MALTICPDCHKEVSDQAYVCIHCGRPFSPDLVAHAAAGSAQAAKEGSQRSKLRTDLGNGIALAGILLGIFIGMANGSLALGLIFVLGGIGLGIWVGYGW